MAKKKRETTIPEITEVEEILEGVEACEKSCRDAWNEMGLAHEEYKKTRKAYETAVEALHRASGVRLERHPLFDANGDDGEQETEA